MPLAAVGGEQRALLLDDPRLSRRRGMDCAPAARRRRGRMRRMHEVTKPVVVILSPAALSRGREIARCARRRIARLGPAAGRCGGCRVRRTRHAPGGSFPGQASDRRPDGGRRPGAPSRAASQEQARRAAGARGLRGRRQRRPASRRPSRRKRPGAQDRGNHRRACRGDDGGRLCASAWRSTRRRRATCLPIRRTRRP